jgi:thioester reductase-like protein
VFISLRLPFCIFKLRSDRSLHFVEAVQALDDARARIQTLGDLWPGEYVIQNEETGERISIIVGDITN